MTSDRQLLQEEQKRTAGNNSVFVLGNHPCEDLSIQDNYRVHVRVTVGFRKL
jgi:hypothetical protein